MSMTVTLSELKTEILQRADMENSDFIDDAELTGYINRSYAALYDLIVKAYEGDYNTLETTLTMVTNQLDYNLPADFYKLAGADLLLSGTVGTASQQLATLYPYNFAERNRFSNASTLVLLNQYPNYRYRLLKNKIRFLNPSGGDTIVLTYVPAITKMVSGSDTMEGVNGWEEYVILDCAIKCRVKEESDVAELMAQKNEMMERITQLAPNRDQGMAEKVSDVQGFDGFFGGYQF